jgi:O-antigen/teichoic acid export membrane protein
MSVLRHAFINFGGAVIPMVVAIATVPVYLSYIGVERYGVLAVIWVLLGYFGFFDFGLGRAVAQRMARLTGADASDRSKLLWTALLSSFSLAVLASLLLGLLSDWLLSLTELSPGNRAEVADTIMWLLLALPVILPTGCLQGALQARLRFVELNAIQLVVSLGSQLLPLAVAATGHVELGVLVPAALFARVLTAVLLVQQCRLHVPLRGRPVIDRVHLRVLMSYGGWVSVNAILAPLLVIVDRLMITTVSGAKAVAYYSVPHDLASRTMIISSSLSSAIFPKLASADSVEAERLAHLATAALVAIMTPAVIFGTFVVHPFLKIWVGEAFAEQSTGVAELILLGVWINALVISYHAKFMATSNPRTISIVYLVEIPIYLAMAWQGLEYWGVVGAAAAWMLRVAMDTCILLYLNKALAKTLRLALPYAALVATATGSIMLINLSGLIYWGLGILLLGLSIFKDRRLLIHSVHVLTMRKGESI